MAKSLFKKASVIMLAASLSISMASAQQQEIGSSGIIGPNSALYGLEVAWDNAAISVGIKKPGQVALERASEARDMAEKNNTDKMNRALDSFNQVAAKAGTNETEGLEKAESVLTNVMERTPEQAQQGLQNAIENVREARRNSGSGEETPPRPRRPPEPENSSDKGSNGSPPVPDEGGPAP